ncbi:hypothetical protein Tco_1410494 [Tanacetum coccineum]
MRTVFLLQRTRDILSLSDPECSAHNIYCSEHETTMMRCDSDIFFSFDTDMVMDYINDDFNIEDMREMCIIWTELVTDLSLEVIDSGVK